MFAISSPEIKKEKVQASGSDIPFGKNKNSIIKAKQNELDTNSLMRDILICSLLSNNSIGEKIVISFHD